MRTTVAAIAVLAGVSTSVLAAPSITEILAANKAAMGGSAWDSRPTVVIDADFNGEGLTGTVHMVVDRTAGRYVQDSKIGPMTMIEGFDGVTPWQKDSSGTVTQQQGGNAVALAINGAYRNADRWWQADFGGAAVANAGQKSDAAGQYDVVTITPKGGKPFEAWFDTRTHLLARIAEQQDNAQTVITTFSNYSVEAGVLVAHKMVVDRGLGAKYLDTVTVNMVRFERAMPDSTFALPKITVSDFSIAGGAGSTALPIQIVNNHIYGNAKVNGQGPFLFIFDTGGHNLVTPPIAQQLGLKVQGQMAGTGAGEGTIEAGFTSGVNLEVGDALVQNQTFIVLPLDKLGDIEGIPLPGMVGYETFRRFVTRIDYGAHTLTLIDPKKFDPRDAGTPVRFVFNEHVPEVTGTFEGIPAKFDIDTGSRADLTITRVFAEANNLRAGHPKGVDAVDGWGVGGPSHAYVTRGADVTLGDVHVGSVVASLSTDAKGAFAGGEYSGNVGAGILKRFVVTFDYNNQIMYLKPLPQPVADTGTFDRAGMWFNRSGTAFKVVDVTGNAPAEEAGVKAGDLIVAVDGHPTETMKLYELRLRLRNDPPGTVVTLKVQRGEAYLTLKVKLRDLI